MPSDREYPMEQDNMGVRGISQLAADQQITVAERLARPTSEVTEDPAGVSTDSR